MLRLRPAILAVLALSCSPRVGETPSARRPAPPPAPTPAKPVPPPGVARDAAWDKKISEALRAETQDAFGNGATAAGVAVVDGERSATAFFGTIASDDPRHFTAKTRFEVGSVSKVFTGLLLAESLLRKEVALSDPVNRHLGNELLVAPQAGSEITLLDAATHAADFPFMPTNWAPAGPDHPPYALAEFREFLKSHGSSEPLGSAYHYSNVGPVLVALALSRRTHEPYRKLLAKRIFAPLSMPHSDFADVPAPNDDLLHGYFAPGKPASMRSHDESVLAPCCVVRTTLEDMVTFIQAAMDPASSLAPAFQLEAEPRHRVEPDGGTWATLGWLWSPRRAELRKNGLVDGKLALLLVRPARRQGLFVVVNTEHARIDEIATRIGDRVFGPASSLDPSAHAKSVIGSLPAAATPHATTFADGVSLVGWSAPERVRAGGLARITLYFRASAQPTRDYRIFVHGDGPGKIEQRLHADHFPSRGEDSTLAWKPGELVEDELEIQVPANYRFPAFRVWFGLHDGARLHVLSGKTDGADRVEGPEIRVTPARATHP